MTKSPRNQLSIDAWSSLSAARDYERARPPYAREAVEFVVGALDLTPSSRVLDLAAGTGKLARQFLPYVGSVVAVEPLEAMRLALAESVPGIEILEGRAESIPLEAGTVDAVVVGQGWHWFDSDRALNEVTRVTTESGGLALLWNEYDQRSDLMAEYAMLRERYDHEAPTHVEEGWRRAFRDSPLWQPLRDQAFPHLVRTTRELFVQRMLTSSVFAVQPEEERRAVRARIIGLLDKWPETAGRDPIDVPYQTEVFWTCKRSGARHGA